MKKVIQIAIVLLLLVWLFGALLPSLISAKSTMSVVLGLVIISVVVAIIGSIGYTYYKDAKIERDWIKINKR